MTATQLFGPYRGVVDQVHDGDTIYVKLDVGFDLTVYARVRVLGINAPELSTEAGAIARDYARSVLPVGSQVSVISHGWDKYGGRVDGTISMGMPVEANGVTYVDFGALMLATGHAVVFKG